MLTFDSTIEPIHSFIVTLLKGSVSILSIRSLRNKIPSNCLMLIPSDRKDMLAYLLFPKLEDLTDLNRLLLPLENDLENYLS